MSIIHLSPGNDEEPTAAELAAIEAEWPRIAADMEADWSEIVADLDVLDSEIAALIAGPYMSEIERRRVRRAERRVLDTRRELTATPETEDAA